MTQRITVVGDGGMGTTCAIMLCQNGADDAMLRQRIASGGYELYQQRLTTRAIAEQLVPVIQEASCASVS